jgi:uncharacterized protein (DUF2336 family)
VTDAGLERVLTVYDTVAVDRAQTVLRYWNWSPTSALTPALLKAIREGDEAAVDEYSSRSGRRCLRCRATLIAKSGYHRFPVVAV